MWWVLLSGALVLWVCTGGSGARRRVLDNHFGYALDFFLLLAGVTMLSTIF